MARLGRCMLALAALSGLGLGCNRSAALPPAASVPRLKAVPQLTTVPVPPPKRNVIPTPQSPPDDRGNAVTPHDPAWTPDTRPRDWKHVVLHHTATDHGDVESIHAAHLDRQWLGIGYHFVIGNGHGMPDGQVEPTFRWRQQLHGAHAGADDYNQHGIGVCLVGNFEDDPPTAAQLAAVKRLVAALKTDYDIPAENVIAHSEVKATACPGRLFPLAEVSRSGTDHLRLSTRSDRAGVAGSEGLREPGAQMTNDQAPMTNAGSPTRSSIGHSDLVIGHSGGRVFADARTLPPAENHPSTIRSSTP